MSRADRGQLVLLAAVAIAVALVPMVTAALQLGYGADVRSTPVAPDRTASTVQVLERGLASAADGVPRRFGWSERSAAATQVWEAMAETIRTVENASLADGVVLEIERNASLARLRAAAACPGGAGREFGDCVADAGVLLQDREGRTHVLAVAVDVVVIGPDRESRTATVLHRVGG